MRICLRRPGTLRYPEFEAPRPAFAGPSETARRGPAARFTARWAARGEARGGLRSKPDPCPAGAGRGAS